MLKIELHDVFLLQHTYLLCKPYVLVLLGEKHLKSIFHSFIIVPLSVYLSYAVANQIILS